MSQQQQAEAQRAANKANAKAAAAQLGLGYDQLGLSEGQFAATTGELAISKREREDEINRQIQERFERLRQENLQRLLPYGEGGQLAAREQQALLGLSGEEAEAEAYARISESPGQKFLRERQERALLRNQAAIGGLGGGNVRTALQEEAYQRSQQAIDERVQQLGALSGQGLTASQTAAGISRAPDYVSTGADTGVRYAATPEGVAEEAERRKAAAEAAAAAAARAPKFNFSGFNMGGGYGEGRSNTGISNYSSGGVNTSGFGARGGDWT